MQRQAGARHRQIDGGQREVRVPLLGPRRPALRDTAARRRTSAPLRSCAPCAAAAAGRRRATARADRPARQRRAPQRGAAAAASPRGSCAGCCGRRSARGRAACRLRRAARRSAPPRRWRRAPPARCSASRSRSAIAARCRPSGVNWNATIDGDSWPAMMSPRSAASAGSSPRGSRPAISPAPTTSTATPPVSRSADGTRTSGIVDHALARRAHLTGDHDRRLRGHRLEERDGQRHCGRRSSRRRRRRRPG